MLFAIGNDHAGFAAKQPVIDTLESLGHDYDDLGTYDEESVDYPDYARRVGEAVAEGDADRGILVCGSGVGVTVAANKIPGVRACVCHDSYTARQGVEHDAMNVLCIGGRVIGSELIAEVVRNFAGATFSGVDRHERRLNKMLEIEQKACGGGYDV